MGSQKLQGYGSCHAKNTVRSRVRARVRAGHACFSSSGISMAATITEAMRSLKPGLGSHSATRARKLAVRVNIKRE